MTNDLPPFPPIDADWPKPLVECVQNYARSYAQAAIKAERLDYEQALIGALNECAIPRGLHTKIRDAFWLRVDAAIPQSIAAAQEGRSVSEADSAEGAVSPTGEPLSNKSAGLLAPVAAAPAQEPVTNIACDVIDGYKAGLAGEPMGFVSAAFDCGWTSGDDERRKGAAPIAAPAQEPVARRLLESDSFCPSCGHNRDTSSVSSIDHKDGTHSCQACNARWRQGAAPIAPAQEPAYEDRVITYTHCTGGYRFRQRLCDPLPSWAYDVREEIASPTAPSQGAAE